MGSLIVITGPPGAGKSTVARALAAAADHSVLVEGDAFFAFVAGGRIEPWLAGSHEQNTVVTEAAASAAGRFALAYSTVFDGVVGPWFLPAFAKATGLDHLDYVILLPPVDLCVQRVGQRTGHGFTDGGATRKMHKEFADAEIPERHVLRPPLGSLEAVVDEIRAASDRDDLRHRVN